MSVVLRAQNIELLVKGKPLTQLSASCDASSGTLTVESIASFAVGNYIAIGQIGNEKTEIVRIHTSTAPSGSTITLVSATAYSHDTGTPVYVIGFNQVEFSRATTEAGSKNVLSTTSITLDGIETIYDDTTNSTGYGFYRFKNEAGSTYSDYSNAIPYSGYDIDSTNEIFQRALSNASKELSPRLTLNTLYGFLNDFIGLANSENKRWSECKVLNEELDTISTGDWEYALPSTIAQKSDPSAIIQLRIGQFSPLSYVPQRTFNNLNLNLVYTTLSVIANDTDVTLSLTNSKAFANSGTVMINGDAISYTGNTRSTNTLTGVTGIVSGGHASGSYVFQREIVGVPTFYTVSSSGYVRVWPVASSEVNNHILYIDYFCSIPRVNSLGDKIRIQDIQSAVDYMTYRIKKNDAGGTLQLDDEDFQLFLKNFRRTVVRDTPGEPLRLSVQ